MQLPERVEKTPIVIEKLKQIALNGFSPSSLSSYLRDPIQFYKRYVLGIKEDAIVEESLASNTIGNIIHNSLESLFLPFLNANAIALQDIEVMEESLTAQLHIQYKNVYRNKTYDKGKNKLIFEVIHTYISNYLRLKKVDIEAGLQENILGLEQSFKVPIEILSLDFPIFMKGTVDYICQRNGVYTIIDYKTGKLNPSHLKIKDETNLLEPGGKYEKALQLLSYAYMIHQEKPIRFPAQLGIVPLKYNTPKLELLSYQNNNLITIESISYFEGILEKLILELFDPNIPFESSEKR